MKALFVVANKDFRDEELFETRRILESHGVKTFTAAKIKGEAIGMLGGKTKIDFELNNVFVSDYDSIIFVGGSGSTIYYDDKAAIRIAKESKLKGKVIGAICMGSGILAKSGILKNLKSTGWETTEDLIDGSGGIYTGKDVEISGRIVTALGPNCSKKFGEELFKIMNKNLEF